MLLVAVPLFWSEPCEHLGSYNGKIMRLYLIENIDIDMMRLWLCIIFIIYQISYFDDVLALVKKASW